MLDAPQHRPRPLPLFLSLLRTHTQHDPARARAALAGLRRYQAAERAPPAAPVPVVGTAGRARLLDYGGDAPGRRVVVVPSLINGPEVLDLLPERSLLRWLAARGLRPLLVDWGTPGTDDRALSIAGHVEHLLLPMLRRLPPDFALAGYCLGGTMALAAAACLRPAALALIAAPWRFGGFPADARGRLAGYWRQMAPTVETIGLMPVELLQAAFWQIDPARTVDKFVAFGAEAQPAAATRLFVALEDWANAGPPLTVAAARELFEGLFGRDESGAGGWQVAGVPIDPAALGCPVLDIVSTSDRIVPAAAAAGIGRSLALAQGHVGMMVGGRAEADLWNPLAEWLRAPNGA